MARDRFEDDDRWSEQSKESEARSSMKAARSKVLVPAWGLIATGVMSFLMLPLGIYQYTTIPEQMAAEKKKMDDNPQMPAAQKQQMKEIFDVYEKFLMVVIPGNWVLQFFTSVLIIIGGVKMKNLKSRGWARTSAILAMIPCFSGCCILGLIFGIWAIVALGDPAVKEAFEAGKAEFDDNPPRDGEVNDGDR